MPRLFAALAALVLLAASAWFTLDGIFRWTVILLFLGLALKVCIAHFARKQEDKLP